MKTITKVLITTAVTLIPLGIFAQEPYEDGEKFDNKTSASHHKHTEDGERSFYKDLVEKGINYSFEGELQSKPKDGLNGIWNIDGVKVVVDDKTFIRQSKKAINIGDTIEIKAKRVDNKIIVLILEQEDGFFK